MSCSRLLLWALTLSMNLAQIFTFNEPFICNLDQPALPFHPATSPPKTSAYVYFTYLATQVLLEITW